MSKRKGLGAILMGLSVVGGTAHGQSPTSSDRPPIIRGVSQVVPKVMVGRPIPLKINSPAPALLPASLRASKPLPSPNTSGVMPIPTMPPPGSIIATTYREVIHAQPQPAALELPGEAPAEGPDANTTPTPEWESDSNFAVDRRPPRPSRSNSVPGGLARPGLPLPAVGPMASGPGPVVTPAPGTQMGPQMGPMRGPLVGPMPGTMSAPTTGTLSGPKLGSTLSSGNAQSSATPLAAAGPYSSPPVSVPPLATTSAPLPGVIDAASFTQGSWKRTFQNDGNLPPLTVVEQPEFMMEGSGTAPRFYGAAEYLLWWTKGDKAPPLVTTGAADAMVVSPGAIGNADTVVVQDGDLSRGPQSGLRLTAGWWLDDCAGKAIEVSGFFLGSRSAKFNASSAQFPVLSRPFFDVVAGGEEVELVSFPGAIAGNVSVNAPSELWGVEANLICPHWVSCNSRVNFLVGPRYLHLTEAINIVEDLQLLTDVNGFRAGDRVRVADSFRTRNQFWGGQVGVEGRWLTGRFTVDGRAKVALGVTNQEVTIDGSQTFLRGVNTDPRPGGLLAVASNIGTQRRTGFSVVPEVGVNLGYYVTDWMRLSVGYNVLYWTNVVRPGDQIDRNVNPFLVPNFSTTGLVNNGALQPTVPFRTTDFWAQGLTFGVEFTF